MARDRLRRRLAAVNESVAWRPDAALVDVLAIPEPYVRAGVIYPPAALWAVVIIFYLDRDGHIDSRDHELTVAVDDRSRRNHPGHPNRPTSQRHCGDAAASGIPDHPDRFHGGIADHPVTTGAEDPAMEEQYA